MNGTYKVDTNSVNKKQTIFEDGIKNFLSAVLDIVVYDLKQKKNFKAVESVLKKLKTDQVFNEAIENNAKIFGKKICDDIEEAISPDQCTQNTICNCFRQFIGNKGSPKLNLCEFCLFISFFLPKPQRDRLQNKVLKKYYKEDQFYLKISLSLEQYLSDDLQEIISQKNKFQTNTESNNNLNHYEENAIKNDNDEFNSDGDYEFNNDKELQKQYIKLLKVIRDDITFGSDKTYKQNKNDLLKMNNEFIEKTKRIQRMYKEMPGWLQSKFRIDQLDDLNIHYKCITKGNGEVVACKLCKENSSCDEIVTNINNILEFLEERNLNNIKRDRVNVSTRKICLMNFLSFFYYGLNLNFFYDVFRSDVRLENFSILALLVLGIMEVLVFIPFTHCLSLIFGTILLCWNFIFYANKFVSNKDIDNYNNSFIEYLEKFFPKYNLDFVKDKTEDIQKSYEYDKIIDKYEEKDKPHIHISSGCCGDRECDCSNGDDQNSCDESLGAACVLLCCCLALGAAGAAYNGSGR